jgi:hypothetical protein
LQIIGTDVLGVTKRASQAAVQERRAHRGVACRLMAAGQLDGIEHEFLAERT